MTENDQKEQFSLAYVRVLATVTGYSFAVPNPDDDSIDCRVGAAGRLGDAALVCSPRIDLQLKATSEAVLKRDRVVFRLPRKNYDDLRDPDPLVPRLLVVLILPRELERWLDQNEERTLLRCAAYWHSLAGMPESQARKKTVYLPRSNLFAAETLQRLMGQVSRKEKL